MSQTALTPTLAPNSSLSPAAAAAPEAKSEAVIDKTPKISAEQGARIALIINRELISYKDIYDRILFVLFSSNRAPDQKNMESVLAQVKNALIYESIQRQICKDMKVHVSDAEIQQAVSNLAKENGMTREEMRALFSKRNVSIQTLENRLSVQRGWMEAVRSAFGVQAAVNEKEVEDELEKQRKHLDKTQYELMEIVLYENDGGRGVQRDIEQIQKELEEGTPFKVLVQQFSQSISAANGGYLGWFVAGSRPPLEEDALKTLKPGSFSKPIRFNGGYRILYMKDLRPAGEAPISASRVTYQMLIIPYPENFSESEKMVAHSRVEKILSDVKDSTQLKKLAKEWEYSFHEAEPTMYADLPDFLEKAFLGASIGKPVGPFRQGHQIIVAVMSGIQKGDPSKILSKDDLLKRRQNEKLSSMAERELRKVMSIASIEDRIGNVLFPVTLKRPLEDTNQTTQRPAKKRRT